MVSFSKLNALRMLSLLLFLFVKLQPINAFYVPQAFNIDEARKHLKSDARSNNTASLRAQDNESPRAALDPHNYTAVNSGWSLPNIDPRNQREAGVHATSSTRNEAALSARDIWSPRITAPDAQTVWEAGSVAEVRWDSTHPPAQVTNYNGKILLGFFEDGVESHEHLDFEHPLAEGFNLTQGRIDVEVPCVEPSNDHFVVLFGDSGNLSPKFTITGSLTNCLLEGLI